MANYASYDGGMRTVGTAAAVGLATGIVGGVVGYFLVRLLVERLGIVEGPPAGVLLFALPLFLTAVCAFLGFVAITNEQESSPYSLWLASEIEGER